MNDDHALGAYVALTPAARLAALRDAVSSAITRLQEAAAIYAAMVASGDDVSTVPRHLRQALERIHERRMLPEVYAELGGVLRQRVALLPIVEQQRVLAGEPVELLVADDQGERVERRDPRLLSPSEALQAISDQGAWRSPEEQRPLLATHRQKPRALPVRVLPRARGIVVEAGTFLSLEDLQRLLAQLGAQSHESLLIEVEPDGRTNHQRIDWRRWDQHLGRISDADLARRIGCTVPAVLYRRRNLGVASFTSQRNQPPAG